jgi:hypothetical protein
MSYVVDVLNTDFMICFAFCTKKKISKAFIFLYTQISFHNVISQSTYSYNNHGSQHRMYLYILFLIYLMTFSISKSSKDQLMDS